MILEYSYTARLNYEFQPFYSKDMIRKITEIEDHDIENFLYWFNKEHLITELCNKFISGHVEIVQDYHFY